MDMIVIYVGLDIDDTQYHGSALNKHTGEVITFQCRPTLTGLLKQTAKLDHAFPGSSLSLCYEASYIGYTLQRDLVKHGYHCDVVTPSSIPSPRSKQIKTDRIDAAQLAQFYANDLLTIVSIPEPEQKQDRDLLRSRKKLVEQRKELRTHTLSAATS
jgi:transposase